MTDELTPAEIAAATGKRSAAAQAAVLARRGVPFTFLGRAVKVARAVAEAHAILPQRPAEPAQPFVYVDGRPAGLIAWQEERNRRRKEMEDEHERCMAVYRAAQPADRLAAKRAVAAARRAAERNQRPAWADLEAIREVYREALRLTHATGVVHHVDHVLPLRGKTVSGLHVHQNLRPLPALENLKKGNRTEQ